MLLFGLELGLIVVACRSATVVKIEGRVGVSAPRHVKGALTTFLFKSL